MASSKLKKALALATGAFVSMAVQIQPAPAAPDARRLNKTKIRDNKGSE